MSPVLPLQLTLLLLCAATLLALRNRLLAGKASGWGWLSGAFALLALNVLFALLALVYPAFNALYAATHGQWLTLLATLLLIVGAWRARQHYHAWHATRESELSLRANQQRLHDYAQTSSDWRWETDAELRLTSLSNSSLPWLGASLPQLMSAQQQYAAGKHELSDELHLKQLQAAVAQHQPFRDFEYCLGVAPEQQWFNISALPYFDQNQVFQGYRGTGTDISERKHIAELLSHQTQRAYVLLSLPHASEQMNESGFIQHCLRLSVELTHSRYGCLGFLENQALAGPMTFWPQPAGDVPPGVDNLHFWQALLPLRHPVIMEAEDLPTVLRADEQVQRLIYVPVVENGQLHMQLCLLDKAESYSELELETIQLIVIALWHLVQNKRASQALQQHHDELEQQVMARTEALTEALEAARQADKTKDAFLSNIGHELRTPLNAVIGMAGLARDISESPRQTDYLDKIIRAGQHLNRLVNDLLDLSKIAAGHLDFVTATFNLRELVYHCCAMMDSALKHKSLACPITLDPLLPRALVGDPSRVEQILLNLLSNAAKFTHQGSIAIRVQLLAQTDADVRLAIEVEDSGIGIRADDLERLFKPFSQIDNTASRQYEGTGLGLVISQHLAKLMGGQISVKSELGRGSTFRVEISLGLGQAQDLTPTENSALPTPAIRYEKVTLLVAEDHPMNREIVSSLLESVGIHGCMVENGQQAVERLLAAEPGHFDLVLMDIQMPLLDGLSACRLIKRHPEFAGLPIIGMTAHTMTHEILHAREAGMVDHIGKPFDNAHFFATLAKWLPQHKQYAPDQALATPPSVVPSPLTALADIPGLDVATALNRFNDNQARYCHWLRDFIQTTPSTLSALSSDIAQNQHQEAEQKAHSLKGRSGMLGMTALHSAMTELDNALRAGTDPSELFTHAEQLAGQMAQALRQALDAAPEPQAATSNNAGRKTTANPLDSENQRLHELIQHLSNYQTLQLTHPTQAKEQCHALLSELFDYTMAHFCAEEAYMQRIAFPGLNEHQAQHRQFSEKLNRFLLDSLQDLLDIAAMQHYLLQWREQHMQTYDQQIIDYVASQARSTS